MDVEEFVSAGKREGWVNETTNVNTIQIGGANVECKVYEVRIDHLHYNIQNGRISTFVSRYRSEHGSLPQDPVERDLVIERMIDQDNHQRLMKTKLDIGQKGQQEVALILTNGTVIDGNRRFTCLRMLSAEEASPRYLRCYIFPDTYDERAIKGLELEIQLGRDEKVHYDPIARLVDINEWVNSGRMSSEEYRTHAGMSKSEMNTALAQINLIDEFLEIIEAPKAYQIAQDLMVDQPFKDLASKLKKCRNEDEREDLKLVVFSNVLSQNPGDRARDFRRIMDLYLNSRRHGGSFAEEQISIAERSLEKLAERPENVAVTTEYLRDSIGADQQTKDDLQSSFERARRRSDNKRLKDSQLESISSARLTLEDVEPTLFEKLATEQLAEMNDELKGLIELADYLKRSVEKTLASKELN